MTRNDLLPPNIIIPENWDKTPIKFLDFLDKTLTGRQYSYIETKLESEMFPIKLADISGEYFSKKIGEIKVEKRQDGLYLVDINAIINIHNRGLYSACIGQMGGYGNQGTNSDVIRCSFQFLYLPVEVNSQEELDAFLRDEKLKEIGI